MNGLSYHYCPERKTVQLLSPLPGRSQTPTQGKATHLSPRLLKGKTLTETRLRAHGLTLSQATSLSDAYIPVLELEALCAKAKNHHNVNNRLYYFPLQSQLNLANG